MSGPQAGLPSGYWGRLAHLVTHRPWRAMLLALAILAPLLAVVPSMQLVNDPLHDLPADTPSVQGFDALARHFPPGDLSPVILVIDHDADLTQPGAFRALGDLSRNLKRLDAVASVRSVAMPTDGEVPDLSDDTEVEGLLDQVDEFTGQLAEAADGARQLEQGLEQVRDGLAAIDAELPALTDGLREAADGAGQLAAGVPRLRAGVALFDDGLAQVDGALAEIAAGTGELQAGLSEARDGAAELRDEVARPAEASIREAWDALTGFTVGVLDPQYRRALESVGETYGRLTGEDPRDGSRVDERYEGLTAALDDLAGGLTEARDGTAELRDGVGQLRAGVGELRDGVGELDTGLAQLEEGSRQLADGLAEAPAGAAELAAGIEQLLDGTDQLLAGADLLATGLELGVAELRDSGFEDLLPGPNGNGEPFVITPAMLDVGGVREQVEFFLADDDTRTRVLVSLAISPFSAEGLAAVREVEEVANFSLQGSPLDDARVFATGTSAFLDELDTAAAADLPLIVAAVLLGVFLVLVLLLKALVAPVYMVLTTLLSYGAALGLTTVMFQWVLGDAGLAWYIPPFLFVILVGAGADYTIYLISRVREEVETRTTRAAVERATAATGGVIASAAFILAGTFLSLLAADLRPLAQIGFAVAAAIVLDALVIRTMLVPAIATVLGRHNWWPSKPGRADATDGSDPKEPEDTTVSGDTPPREEATV